MTISFSLLFRSTCKGYYCESGLQLFKFYIIILNFKAEPPSEKKEKPPKVRIFINDTSVNQRVKGSAKNAKDYPIAHQPWFEIKKFKEFRSKKDYVVFLIARRSPLEWFLDGKNIHKKNNHLLFSPSKFYKEGEFKKMENKYKNIIF